MIRDTRFLKGMSILVIIFNVLQIVSMAVPGFPGHVQKESTLMLVVTVLGCLAGTFAAVLALLKKHTDAAVVLGAVFMGAAVYRQFTTIFASGITVVAVLGILIPFLFSDALSIAREKRGKR